jgi:hypothetical protein
MKTQNETKITAAEFSREKHQFISQRIYVLYILYNSMYGIGSDMENDGTFHPACANTIEAELKRLVQIIQD